MPTVFCTCGEQFQVVEQHFGRRIQCGRCGRRFEVVRPPENQRAEPDPRRSQQRDSDRPEPPRDPYRADPYRQAPPRDDPYRDPYRNDPYRGQAAPPPPYRDDYRHGDPAYDEGYEGERGGYKAKLERVGGFFTPQVRLILFIAFAGLALMAAAVLLSTLKPAEPSMPAQGSAEEG